MTLHFKVARLALNVSELLTIQIVKSLDLSLVYLVYLIKSLCTCISPRRMETKMALGSSHSIGSSVFMRPI